MQYTARVEVDIELHRVHFCNSFEIFCSLPKQFSVSKGNILICLNVIINEKSSELSPPNFM